MARPWKILGILAALAAAAAVVGCVLAATRTRAQWSPKESAAYLDRREQYWREWPAAATDHGTFCVSCHTAMPYAFARPSLRTVAGQPGAPAPEETALLENVRKRVRIWDQTEPYYKSMPEQSRGTEAVLNALILAGHDSEAGKLSPETRAAFDILWKHQQTAGAEKGAWAWILFDNEPWEAMDSPYYGATLAAVAVGIAPENYAASAEAAPHVAALRDYLRREASAQTPLNRVNLLWASIQLPGLLSTGEQQAIVKEIVSRQQADGGWATSSFMNGWKREDGTPQITHSDGYATGLVTLTLETLGSSDDSESVARGLSWLSKNQGRWEGQWGAYSLNRRRHNPYSNVARFMDDAATSYAVLALTAAERAPKLTAPGSTSASAPAN
jgi:squalene-hopene/tetraprenyl-beta-curcumene cyclase